MSNGKSMVGVRALPASLEVLAAAFEPPGFVRLEPQSVSGDPTPGLEARLHDPLWLLARQWQLGEFHGEDAGTPVAVHASYASVRATAWQPGDPAAGLAVQPLARDAVLDELVERERAVEDGPGLRQRANAGVQLLDDLADAAIGGVRDALLAACSLDVANAHDDPFDHVAPSLAARLAGRAPDAESAARDLEAAGAGSPSWLAGASDPSGARKVVLAWLAWYRRGVAPLPTEKDSWIDARLEHRFSVRLGEGPAAEVLRAPSFGGGRVDWYAFDHDAGATLGDGTGTTTPTLRDVTLLATPLRYAGMPADRYWQFEDGLVNFGMLETQPHDLARLCLAEFAMIYGNDWLVVPLDVDTDAHTRVVKVEYTTTFGERLVVDPPDDASRPGRFSMFGLSRPGTSAVLDGLWLPPSAPEVHEGRALEDVLLLRDPTAAMGWAVERVVQGPSGDARMRRDEPQPTPPSPGTERGAELDYILATEVPDAWIPLVPVATSPGAMAFRKGAMVKDRAPILPRGVLLRPTPLTIEDEELAREGVRVRRVPALARRSDGSYVRWIGRRVTVGRGEGDSGLAYDHAIRRNAPPLREDDIGMVAPPTGAPPEPASLPEGYVPLEPPGDPPLPAAYDATQLPALAPTADPDAADGNVKLAQAMLNATLPIAPLVVDGNFGPATTLKLQAFQAGLLLPATGTLDAETWLALSAASPLPQLEQGPGDAPMAGPPVATLQSLLNLAGASPFVAVDGVFTDETLAALEDFQARHGVPVTGIVDLASWIALVAVPGDVGVATTTMRFTFSYDSEDWSVGGPIVRLVSRKDVSMSAPLGDDVEVDASQTSGFRYELHDETGRPVYRRSMHWPLAVMREVAPGIAEPDIGTFERDTPRGRFELIAPRLPRARRIVLFDSPLDPDRRGEPAAPIASFELLDIV
ncbi:MAG TPA: peptidoglycan-binding protein [Casimicrobiaceae bacterium]|nr:peptidoglycan-binding protein [Casimicrobiaceae bacterium]